MLGLLVRLGQSTLGHWADRDSRAPSGAARVRTAVLTTSATSLGWEIMTTCEAPLISVTVRAHALVAEAVDAGVDAPVGGRKHRPGRTAAPRRGGRGLGPIGSPVHARPVIWESRQRTSTTTRIPRTHVSRIC